MNKLPLIGILLTVMATTAVAQRGGPQPHRANGGRIPPAPVSRTHGAKTEVETFPGGKIDARPHVADDRWYGHDDATDARFRLAQPFAHGRFAKVGPSFQYRVTRFDVPSHRFWIGTGLGFEVASWDWPFAASWCWSCADDFVVYDDPDHAGWYLVYNTETGLYVHAQYIGT